MVSASSDAKHYLPGGVAMMARGKIEGCITGRVPDNMGRYTYMSLKGKNNTGVLVVTVYRVCQKKGTKTGPDTAYMQQHVSTREAGIKDPDPRKTARRPIATDSRLEAERIQTNNYGRL